MYILTCTHVHIYVCAYIYVNALIYVYTQTHTHVYTYIHVYTYVQQLYPAHISIYLSIQIRNIYTFMFIRIYVRGVHA